MLCDTVLYRQDVLYRQGTLCHTVPYRQGVLYGQGMLCHIYRQVMLCHCVQDANRSVYFFRKTIADIDQSEFDGFEYVNPLLMSMEDCV